MVTGRNSSSEIPEKKVLEIENQPKSTGDDRSPKDKSGGGKGNSGKGKNSIKMDQSKLYNKHGKIVNTVDLGSKIDANA